MKPEKPERINLRLPADLRRKIEETAAQNGRSVNAELVERIEKSLSPYTICFEDHWIKAMLVGYSIQAEEKGITFTEHLLDILEPKPAPTPEEYVEEYGRLLEEIKQQRKEMEDFPALVEKFVNQALARRQDENE